MSAPSIRPERPYQPSNSDKNELSPIFMAAVADGVKLALGRRVLTYMELEYIKRMILSTPQHIVAGKPLEKVKQYFVQKISESIKRRSCEQDREDIHEIQKQEIGDTAETGTVELPAPERGPGSIKRRDGPLGKTDRELKMQEEQYLRDNAAPVNVLSILGKVSTTDLLKMFNPKARIVQNRLVLDSKYRILLTDGTQNIQWNFVPNLNLTQGSTNILGKIRDIVSIRVFPTRIPYVRSAINDLNRITMLISEMQAQSVIAQEGKKYHTVFTPHVQADFIDLDPYYHNYGIFRFEKPITELSTITVSFGAPIVPVAFTPDRLPSVVTFGNPTILTTTPNIPTFLNSGNQVYINGVTTLDDAKYIVVLSTLNNQYFPITVIDPYTYSIPVDTSEINFLLTGTVAATNGLTAVTGTGTLFTSQLTTSDRIRIIDNFGNQSTYSIANIIDDTHLVLAAPFTGITGALMQAYRDNSVPGSFIYPYYESKRIRIEIELSYIYPGDGVSYY